jgi:hypothetical protein
VTFPRNQKRTARYAISLQCSADNGGSIKDNEQSTLAPFRVVGCQFGIDVLIRQTKHSCLSGRRFQHSRERIVLCRWADHFIDQTPDSLKPTRIRKRASRL